MAKCRFIGEATQPRKRIHIAGNGNYKVQFFKWELYAAVATPGRVKARSGSGLSLDTRLGG